MKPRPLFLACALVVAASAAVQGQDLTQAFDRAAADYRRRIDAAAAELNATRERIAEERSPLLEETRTLQDRIIGLESEIRRLETAQARAEQRRQELQIDLDLVNKNLGYVASLAQDGLKGFEAALAPGEGGMYAERLQTLESRLEGTANQTDPGAALDAVNLMLERLALAVGGYAAPGELMLSADNSVVAGTFAFVGPETYFRAANGEIIGTVRTREGSRFPVVYPLGDWNAGTARAFFEGREGTILADVSGGKALRLRESRGTTWDHVQKGGIVGYIIIALGAFALLATLVKILDLGKLSVDDPVRIQRILDAVACGSRSEAEELIRKLRVTTRELLETGFRHLEKPKALLEEHLFAFILRTRLRHERRLPLLAVIAAAAPLLGLLGTVTGMVKTFTLITVYGTGNAGKLSSGISEALVTTELGLIVAIPTLVIHGYLSHRTQKSLSLLERYAVEFVTAAEEEKLVSANGTSPDPPA